MALDMDSERARQLVADLQGFHLGEFDEELSTFRAERMMEFILERVGPQVYNQAVQDARGYMQGKLDDLDGEIHWLERS